ncbi:ExeM/NucH family extracellular endonuclease [Uliginosibacterium sp. 31-12]|uniref:ExeM/NucH family extracellular endonuclease n=1 Tax=Uliginosibacterium sp. 31-12 TaxID=3062781 RepID=UPI0026E26622|nr:ExeM/NucH family extracellular endonuclease [Uliginosibacterium sp. 31-12]MDO6387715.1 ExeM/NucH family extracellular endonuclease [Uliginosibacterium sp. 31-12]
MVKLKQQYPALSAMVAGAFALGLAACGGGGTSSSESAVASGSSAGSSGASSSAAASSASSTSASSASSVALPACATPTNPLQAITAVQGSTDTSPLAGQAVAVRGVVTAIFQADTQLKGFFIQQPVADADPLTSEGLFIYAPSAATVAVGDYVQVEGSVLEYKASSDTRALTEISAPTAISVCGNGLSIAPVALSLPLTSADAMEAYEGMLVKFEQTLTVTDVSDLGHYGSVQLSSGRLWEPYNHPSLSASAATSANALNRMILDDGSTKAYPNPIPYLSASDTSGTRRVGDTVAGVAGALTWSSNAWRVHPSAAPAFVASNPRSTAPASVGGTLKAAHYNLENFFTTLGSRGAVSSGDFTRQRAKLVEAIAGIDADVLALIETQNDAGYSLDNLVTALNAKMGAGTYRYIDAGIAGDDEITSAMIYKPAKVSPVGNVQIITDTNFAVSGGIRPSIAQRFAALSNGGMFWMVANHLKSKGSCPSSSSSVEADYGQGCWNASRVTQAKALRDWVASLVSSSGESDVLMMGDFNAYLNEDPLAVLESAGYEAVLRRLPAEQRYSYQFDGTTGALDHAFASSSLKAQLSGISVWHINSEEPEIIDYTTASKTDDRYAVSPYRGSDHDPVVVGLTLGADAAVAATTLSASVPSTGTAGTAVSITNLSASNGSSLSVSWGDGTTESLATTVTGASHTYAAAGSYSITLTLTGSGLPAKRISTIKISAASTGGTTSGPDLFFSEYIEGTSNNKALEIYNPLSSSVDLSAYTVRMYANGGTTATNSLTLSGSLAAGGTLIIRHPSFTSTYTFPASAISSSVTNFNGDDAVTLEKSGAVIDGIGVLGVDPGVSWTSGSVATQDKTLRRKAGVTQGSIPGTSWDVAAEWDVYDVDSFGGLGAR